MSDARASHTAGRRRPSPALALLLATHPGPAAAVTLISLILAIGIGLNPWRAVLLGVAILLNQASVGLSNDWIDSDRDRAVGRTDKPVALGWVSVRVARSAAFATAGLALVATLPLGTGATIAHAVFIVFAWAYNAGLKNSMLSVLPYIVSFGALPSVVTLSLANPALAAPWATGLGALLGVAAHFANVLPDFADDGATGIRGLPHALGRTGSGIAICGALAIGALLALVGPTGSPNAIQWAGAFVTLVLAAVIGLLLTRPPTRLLFQLIIGAAVVNVILLATAGERVLSGN